MQLLTLTEIRRSAQNGAVVEARVHVQIEGAATKVDARSRSHIVS